MSEQIWKDIPGYEGLYKISNTGEVLSMTYNKLRVFSKSKSNTRYYQVNLWKNNKWKTLLVHRLVMLAFKWPSNLCVDHVNGDILDNRIENLEYVTHKENNHRAVNNWQSRWDVWSKPIVQYGLNMEFICEYKSTQEANKLTWIWWSAISKCLTGKNKTSGWFIWKYK